MLLVVAWFFMLLMVVFSEEQSDSESVVRGKSAPVSVDVADSLMAIHSSRNLGQQYEPASAGLHAGYKYIIDDPAIIYDSSITLFWDPPNSSFAPSALGVYVGASDPRAQIYYAFEELNQYSQYYLEPTYPFLAFSPYATFSSPYIQLDHPFGSTTKRYLTIVAVVVDGQTTYRSQQYTLSYFVDAGTRKGARGFLVPGVESNGYFVKFTIEMVAKARAQVAGGQEFADFNTYLGVGLYQDQTVALPLNKLDPDLVGFEGGFSVNCTDGNHYGILVPFHNGKKFVGKVVRVNLLNMGNHNSNISHCMNSYRLESYGKNHNAYANGSSWDGRKHPAASAKTACIFVIDLATINQNARGFRRGFAQQPYAFLSPGEFNVAVRLDVCNFGVKTTVAIDLGKIDKTLGGYSGGFADGSWACFNPFRTFTGPFGGVRSTAPVDIGHLRVIYNAIVLCLDEKAWKGDLTYYKTFDLSTLDPYLRGFSEALRVGRYAYFAPIASQTHTYTSRCVRIFLGDGITIKDIGAQLDNIATLGKSLGYISKVLDLSQKYSGLAGFGGLFTSGQYIFLVPYRNAHEGANGQRGHGNVVRIDMNDFSLNGVYYVDLATITRVQIPSFADEDLRGFCCGFASGQYGFLVPFFNGLFSGKVARFIGVGPIFRNDVGLLDLTHDVINVQELDFTEDQDDLERNYTARLNTYKGYRGGFVSLWPGYIP